MDVAQITAQRAPQTSATADPGRAAITSDFQTFLTMLTAQMQNQDPLNPIESTDFATQLATFSGVEQQVRSNDLLSSLQSQMSLMGMGQLSGWIGMEARAEMPVAFTGHPVALLATPDTGADRVELSVMNDQGALVQTLTIPVGSAPFLWDGTDGTGAPLPHGTYSFTSQSFIGEEPQASRPVQTFAEVEEAELRSGETWLTMAGGISVPASAVQGIRNR